jgi:hypothetical protein
MRSATWVRIIYFSMHLCRHRNKEVLLLSRHLAGVHYEKGIGVTKDPVEAVRLYRLATDQKNSHAQFNLGE